MQSHSALGSLRRRVRSSTGGRKRPIPPVFQRLSSQKCTWKKKLKPLFTRQLAAEEYARYLGYKFDDSVLCERERWKSIGGPGYYYPIFHTYKESIMAPNKGFTTSLRSTLISRHNYPAPGTYFPDIFNNFSAIKKSLSKIQPFQWNIHKSRFKPEPSYKWRQCPTQYKPNDVGSIDALLKKRVSTRGPYDLFTGRRDYSTIKNHFSQKAVDAPDKVYDNICDGLDYLLKHPRKKNYGVVYRKAAYTTKDFFRDRHGSQAKTSKREIPGPTTYNITSHTIQPKPRSKVPFNSTEHVPCIQNLTPGPGRYFLPRQLPRRKRGSQMTIQSRYLQRNTDVTIVKTQNLKKAKQLELKLRQEDEEPVPDGEQAELDYKPLAETKKLSCSSFLTLKHSFVKSPLFPSLCKAATSQPLRYTSWHVVPTSIQSVLLRHPAVLDVIIIGFPSQLKDDNPFALVILRDGFRTVTEDCLLEYLNHKLAFRNHIRGGLRIVKEQEIVRTNSGRLTASTVTMTINQNPKGPTPSRKPAVAFSN